MLAVVGKQIVLLHVLKDGICCSADIREPPVILANSFRLTREEGNRTVPIKTSGTQGSSGSGQSSHRGNAVLQIGSGNLECYKGELR